ncbi:hypothetical protein A2V68_00500 [candidate division Kazan bacterium RBG_13_50_9]|uniref:Probable transcriptional regulatory protein A2V68_00500 n=1 Tax=candidate division Kazan bacterium RBG_13_50_9 TaxID=1798535 RepID=A0A1F4NRV7_UNCK3|nr:MAG: hypothetical protein A2V68_00500 [candidate division Kazan bacterium RBG_13_50_9]
MSGHSKWSTIKHKKGAADAKRGAEFSKLARLVEVAAKSGADPEMNFRLKLAVQKAKAANMPGSNIDKAIRKGSGADKEASQLEEVIYEGLGPGNVGVIVQALTGNKNRTVAELRHIFTRYGGNFGTPVAWQFAHKGILEVAKASDAEAQELSIIDAGALDLEDAGDSFEVYTDSKELDTTKSKLEAAGMSVKSASLGLVPKNKTEVKDPAVAKKALALLDALEEHDDVSSTSSTLDVPDELLNQLE